MERPLQLDSFELSALDRDPLDQGPVPEPLYVRVRLRVAALGVSHVGERPLQHLAVRAIGRLGFGDLCLCTVDFLGYTGLLTLEHFKGKRVCEIGLKQLFPLVLRVGQSPPRHCDFLSAEADLVNEFTLESGPEQVLFILGQLQAAVDLLDDSLQLFLRDIRLSAVSKAKRNPQA